MDDFANATPALVGALDAAVPRWRAMDRAAFDAWRRDIPEREGARLRLAVARAVLGVPLRGNRELDALIGRAEPGDDEPRKNLLNEALLPLWGEGPDSFFLNEHFAEGEGTWSFATLRAHDEADHDFQERFRADESDGSYVPRPYRGRMLWDWARWIEDGRLVYGTLSVAASRLSSEIEEFASDRVDSAFPTKHERGPGDGDPVAGGRARRSVVVLLPEDMAAMALAANRACWAEVARLHEERWAPHFAAEPAWLVNEADFREHERDRALTFSGPAALDRVRPGAFLADLAALPDGTEAYASYAAEERRRFGEWLDAEIGRIRSAEPGVSPAP